MKITLQNDAAARIEAQALVSLVFEAPKEAGKSGQAAAPAPEVDPALAGALAKLAASGEVTGKLLEMTLVHFVPGVAAERILLVGAGKRASFGTPELRKLAAAAVRYLKSRSIKRVAFLAPEGQRSAAAAQAVTEGLLLGNFEGDKYRTDK